MEVTVSIIIRGENQAVLLRAHVALAYRNHCAVRQVFQRLRGECVRAYRHSIICAVDRQARARRYRRKVYVARQREFFRLFVVREQRVVLIEAVFAVRAYRRERVNFVGRLFPAVGRIHFALRKRQIAFAEHQAVFARVICRQAQRRARLQAVALEDCDVVYRYYAVAYAYRRADVRGDRTRCITRERYRIRAEACQREMVLLRVIREQRIICALEARNARADSEVLRCRRYRNFIHRADRRIQILTQRQAVIVRRRD